MIQPHHPTPPSPPAHPPLPPLPPRPAARPVDRAQSQIIQAQGVQAQDQSQAASSQRPQAQRTQSRRAQRAQKMKQAQAQQAQQRAHAEKYPGLPAARSPIEPQTAERPPLPLLQWSWRKFWGQVSFGLGIASAIGLVTGGFWVSVQLMLDPSAVGWLQPHLPETKPTGEDDNAPKSMAQIQADIEASGYVAAEPIELINDPNGKFIHPPLLIPVLEQRSPCSENCEIIRALRLYQPLNPTAVETDHPTRRRYYLVTELPVNGFPESQAIAPLVDSNPGLAASNRPLPFLALRQFHQLAPKAGIWFDLIGERQLGDTKITYGQVFHFNPSRLHLSPLIQWSSPSGDLPHWEQFTGDGDPELVVNQTVGLEPNYWVYQVRSRDFVLDPVDLSPISLAEPALDDPTYRQAMLLARSGLWSAALARLEPLAQRRRSQGQSWSAAAQAQLDLVGLHARSAQSRADSTWASPDQAVVAALLDGRWSQALQIIDQSETWANDVFPALKTNTMRLWRRVETSLRVMPEDEAAKTWGAILLAARTDRSQALAWLKTQNVNATQQQEADQFLTQLIIAGEIPGDAPQTNAERSDNASVDSVDSVNSGDRANSVNPPESENP